MSVSKQISSRSFAVDSLNKLVNVCHPRDRLTTIAFFSHCQCVRVRALSVPSLCLGCGPIEKHRLCTGCVSCVCGHLFVLRAAKGALFLCSGCVSCVYEYPLCAQAAGKSAPALCSDCVPCVHGYPHCAQTVGKKCIRTVLRLFFFVFFSAGRMQHPPVDEKQKKARP